ncbi:MAG: Fur family transcriptional regulator [Acidiferrobacterales bacterium]
MSAKTRRHWAAQLERATQVCARQGAQLTTLRRHVLGLILEADAPLTAYQLLDRLRLTHKGAAPPTIYRALDFLMAQHLVHKIERLNAFIPCAEVGHRHPAQFLICCQCGVVSEIENRAATNALEHAAEQEGFRPRNTMVEIEGVCAACFRPS